MHTIDRNTTCQFFFSFYLTSLLCRSGVKEAVSAFHFELSYVIDFRLSGVIRRDIRTLHPPDSPLSRVARGLFSPHTLSGPASLYVIGVAPVRIRIVGARIFQLGGEVRTWSSPRMSALRQPPRQVTWATVQGNFLASCIRDPLLSPAPHDRRWV